MRLAPLAATRTLCPVHYAVPDEVVRWKRDVQEVTLPNRPGRATTSHHLPLLPPNNVPRPTRLPPTPGFCQPRPPSSIFLSPHITFPAVDGLLSTSISVKCFSFAA